ncbi:MAG: deoxyguanosinetriphosphate triphosphohydrolase [Candidatus Omnitrophica bacterium]|nr:deoxyguanosinetriphosphate triphosphohydrolase [Candidatus Omnitrophota bacterium]
MLTRNEIESKEEKLLAPYAMRSKKSGGRDYKEEEHPYRSRYQRDKDRIIYSRAFRRLVYKTQVFVNHEGDHYRTRLTHTLEVAQIARTIARSLRLNEDLVEAISLAHDLGHTPFGHSGEDALREIMKKHGGFDHNSHGLRVVTLLEKRYLDFPGLNLTYEVREGIIKHTSTFDQVRIASPFESKSSSLLEAQVVDIADEIAYDNHDLEDGITSDLIKPSSLKSIGLWRDIYDKIKAGSPNASEEMLVFQAVRKLINRQVMDLLDETEKRINKYKIMDCRQVRKFPERIVKFSKSMNRERKPMKDFLMKNLYNHYRVIRMHDKARRFIQDLFKTYISRPEQLAPSTRSRLKKEGKYRVICDYIAGMTDRYALDEYKRLFEPYERV